MTTMEQHYYSLAYGITPIDVEVAFVYRNKQELQDILQDVKKAAERKTQPGQMTKRT